MKYPASTIAFTLAIALSPEAAGAQSPLDEMRTHTAAADPAPVCYGFSFGAWTPVLDRVAAGHDPDARGGPGAPDGRSWAATDSGSTSSLILFPGWWPAGVRVTLPAGPPAIGGSARGTAVALVADGRKRSPTAPIVVQGVPCGRHSARLEPDGR